MSRQLYGFDNEFELGEWISFLSPDRTYRMIGEVVRVYNSRTLYHAEVNGTRYEVDYNDEPRKEHRPSDF